MGPSSDECLKHIDIAIVKFECGPCCYHLLRGTIYILKSVCYHVFKQNSECILPSNICASSNGVTRMVLKFDLSHSANYYANEVSF